MPEMQNAKYKMGVFPPEMIEIVAYGDTIAVNCNLTSRSIFLPRCID